MELKITHMVGKVGRGAKIHNITKVEEDGRVEYMCFCGAGIVNRPGHSPVTPLADDAEVTCSKCLWDYGDDES